MPSLHVRVKPPPPLSPPSRPAQCSRSPGAATLPSVDVDRLNSLPLPDLFAALGCQAHLGRLLELAREEDLDCPGWDITTLASVPAGKTATAKLVARENLTVSGLACLPGLLAAFAPGVIARTHTVDGRFAPKSSVLAEFSGRLDGILALERTTLNMLSRLSGIATLAAEFTRRVEGVGRARIYDTRKTTPGWRVLEKYAVRCGGAMCHRVGLFDAVLLKDNHITGVPLSDLARFVAAAAARARALSSQERRPLSFVELEVDSLEQFECILAAGGCGVDIVLLDNMTPELLRRAVDLRDRSNLGILLEASGGVRLETVAAIAATGVERISAGAITHHAVAVDLAFDIDPE